MCSFHFISASNIFKIADNSLPNRARVPWNNSVDGVQNNSRASAFEDEETQTPNLLKRKRDSGQDENVDPKLKEFLGVMQRPSQQKSWQNEDMDGVEDTLVSTQNEEAVADAEEESEEEYQTISKKHKSKGDSKALISQPDPIPKLEPSQEIPADPGAEFDGPKAGQSDADWLRSKTSRLLGLVDDEEERPSVVPTPIDEDMDSEAPEKTPRTNTKKDSHANDGSIEESEAPVNADEEAIRNSRRLFLRNLPYTVSEDDLTEHFAELGNLKEVSLICISQYPTLS
jgi:multiple RNA-binding domain-containing protein 1